MSGRLAWAARLTGCPAFWHIAGRMVMIDLDADPDLVAPAVEGVRIFAGYSGWTIGQPRGRDRTRRLDCFVRAAPDVLFEPRTDLWSKVLRRQPLPPRDDGHPSHRPEPELGETAAPRASAADLIAARAAATRSSLVLTLCRESCRAPRSRRDSAHCADDADDQHDQAGTRRGRRSQPHHRRPGSRQRPAGSEPRHAALDR